MNGPVAFKPTLTPEQIAQNEAFLKSLEPEVVIEPSPPWEELTPAQRKLVIDTLNGLASEGREAREYHTDRRPELAQAAADRIEALYSAAVKLGESA